MSAPRSWTIELPAGLPLLNSNRQVHPKAKSRITKKIRTAAKVMGLAAKIPRLERASVVCEYRPPSATRLRDGGNWWPSFKPAIDGALVDAGVLADDNSNILVDTSLRVGPVDKQSALFRLSTGRLVLIVTEVLPVDGGG
ncbi:MAG: Endodeoxyribonuclease RusA [Gemmatimonadales bacterium]|nr:Endodeoxyribonuclease RusA [Gemmatimonadales bacterium]